MRGRVGLAVAASAFALGAAIMIVHQVRLQRAVGNLRGLVEAETETLDEVLRTQRMVLSGLGRLDRHMQDLDQKSSARGDEGEKPSGGRAAVATEPAEPQAPAPSPEVEQSVQKGNSVIDAAIASGQWTDANRHDLRAVIRTVPQEQASALIFRVLSAIKAHQLSPDRGGPPI